MQKEASFSDGQNSQPGTAQYQLIWGTLDEKLLLSASAHYNRSSSHPSDAVLELIEAALPATVVAVAAVPLGIHRATFSSSVMECRLEGSRGISDDGFFPCKNSR